MRRVNQHLTTMLCLFLSLLMGASTSSGVTEPTSKRPLFKYPQKKEKPGKGLACFKGWIDRNPARTCLPLLGKKKTGTYEIYERKRTVYGRFTALRLYKNRRLLVGTWHDRYGTGQIYFVFRKHQLSFKGTWGTRRSHRNGGRWSGKR